MSCHEDQGTANPAVNWPYDIHIEPERGSNVATSGYLQVGPERFTREELQAIRNKASDLLPWTNMAEFDLLEDLVNTLDLLDALAAREEADLAELDETITEHLGSGGLSFTHIPPCAGCPHYLND